MVTGTNRTVVCTPLTFGQGTYLSNTNGTRAERLAWVFWETNHMANGTLAASEKLAYGPTNQITHFRMTGQLQFTVPGSGANPPVIYKGNLIATSGAVGDEDDDDDDIRMSSTRY